MSLKSSGAWRFAAGLMAGSTMAYLLVVLLGLILPSWPFNAFFTPLVLFGLFMQWPIWFTPAGKRRAAVLRGMGVGAITLALVWVFYFFAPALSLRGLGTLFSVVLTCTAGLVYWRHRHYPDGRRRSLALFVSGAAASSYLSSALVILLFINAACAAPIASLCPYAMAPFVQPMAVTAGLTAFLFLWVRHGASGT